MDSPVGKTVYELLVTEVVRLGMRALHAAAHSRTADARDAVEAQMMILKRFPDIIIVPIIRTEEVETSNTAKTDVDSEYKEMVKYLNGMLKKEPPALQQQDDRPKAKPLSVSLTVGQEVVARRENLY